MPTTWVYLRSEEMNFLRGNLDFYLLGILSLAYYLQTTSSDVDDMNSTAYYMGIKQTITEYQNLIPDEHDRQGPNHASQETLSLC